MLTRRNMIGLASLMTAVALWPLRFAQADTNATHPASEFLDTMRQRAITGLTDPERGEKERESIFRTLLNETFDIPTIGRFVVGAHWRKAETNQQRDFLLVFEDVIVQRFLPLFAQYKGEKLIVEGAHSDTKNPKYTIVNSTYIDAQGRQVKTDWRLREKDGRFKVFDVLVEGVSMAITLRSEYAEVIKNAGGLAGLVDLLRDKLARGDFKPAVAAQ